MLQTLLHCPAPAPSRNLVLPISLLWLSSPDHKPGNWSNNAHLWNFQGWLLPFLKQTERGGVLALPPKKQERKLRAGCHFCVKEQPDLWGRWEKETLSPVDSRHEGKADVLYFIHLLFKKMDDNDYNSYNSQNALPDSLLVSFCWTHFSWKLEGYPIELPFKKWGNRFGKLYWREYYLFRFTRPQSRLPYAMLCWPLKIINRND